MGQAVLANQFAAGLLLELKTKVAGTEGKLEQLLTKARFEEAKLRELPGNRVDGSSTNHLKFTRGPWPGPQASVLPRDTHHPNIEAKGSTSC